MDLELQGKRAIVTGGSRGIGKQIARLLGFEGVDVAIAARDPERLAATAEELSEETGRRVLPYTVDTGTTPRYAKWCRRPRQTWAASTSW